MDSVPKLNQQLQSGAPQIAKAVKAGEQFEAVLLNEVFGGVEHAFTSLPGAKKENSIVPYHGLAMQALALHLAQAGGVGIGRLIAKCLENQESANQSRLAPDH